MKLELIKQKFQIVGDCPKLNTAIERAMRVATTDVSVLVQGENGTGKDIFSRIIHSSSNRKHKTLLSINCGGLPEGIIDSALFGHVKGSFSGAIQSHKGYFEEANGGTLFLDEIGELPMSSQAKLLRVLETGEFFRVGSSKSDTTDVRIVAATNKNLLKCVSNGTFREDLYYRLCGMSICIPSLRERGLDVEKLFIYFASAFAEKNQCEPVTLTEDGKLSLCEYSFPGNIRQLKNVVDQISVLEDSREINTETINRYFEPERSIEPLTLAMVCSTL